MGIPAESPFFHYLFHAETVFCFCMELLPCLYHGTWEVVMMHGVRELLGFKSHRTSVRIGSAAFSSGLISQEVACVDLDTRIICKYFHDNTGFFGDHFRDWLICLMCIAVPVSSLF